MANCIFVLDLAVTSKGCRPYIAGSSVWCDFAARLLPWGERSYATASIVSADRIVFNIKGNDYRLVVAADFDKGIVWIGTHKDYDKIDVREVRHGG